MLIRVTVLGMLPRWFTLLAEVSLVIAVVLQYFRHILKVINCNLTAIEVRVSRFGSPNLIRSRPEECKDRDFLEFEHLWLK